MASRKKGYLQLTEAQRFFRFRTLKQLSYYLEHHAQHVRQESTHGRRRWVHVGDLALALLAHDPRPEQDLPEEHDPCADRDPSDGPSAITGSARSDTAQTPPRALKPTTELKWENQSLKEFLKTMGLFKSWKEDWDKPLRKRRW